MSKITKWYCDHCGKEINEDEDYVDYEIELHDDTLEADLCRSCLLKMEKQIKDFVRLIIDD